MLKQSSQVPVKQVINRKWNVATHTLHCKYYLAGAKTYWRCFQLHMCNFHFLSDRGSKGFLFSFFLPTYRGPHLFFDWKKMVKPSSQQLTEINNCTTALCSTFSVKVVQSLTAETAHVKGTERSCLWSVLTVCHGQRHRQQNNRQENLYRCSHSPYLWGRTG